MQSCCLHNFSLYVPSIFLLLFLFIKSLVMFLFIKKKMLLLVCCRQTGCRCDGTWNWSFTFVMFTSICYLGSWKTKYNKFSIFFVIVVKSFWRAIRCCGNCVEPLEHPTIARSHIIKMQICLLNNVQALTKHLQNIYFYSPIIKRFWTKV